MYIYIYIYIYVHTYIYIYIYTHTHTHTHKHTISLLSLQAQPKIAPDIFQRGVEYGRYSDMFSFTWDRSHLEHPVWRRCDRSHLNRNIIIRPRLVAWKPALPIYVYFPQKWYEDLGRGLRPCTKRIAGRCEDAAGVLFLILRQCSRNRGAYRD